MIFYYRKVAGRWQPRKAQDAPIVRKHDRPFFSEGHELPHDLESMSLDALTRIYPAPGEAAE